MLSRVRSQLRNKSVADEFGKQLRLAEENRNATQHNDEGKVIGINFAMVREFGGSNFAIPVGYGKSLLKP